MLRRTGSVPCPAQPCVWVLTWAGVRLHRTRLPRTPVQSQLAASSALALEPLITHYAPLAAKRPVLYRPPHSQTRWPSAATHTTHVPGPCPRPHSVQPVRHCGLPSTPPGPAPTPDNTPSSKPQPTIPREISRSVSASCPTLPAPACPGTHPPAAVTSSGPGRPGRHPHPLPVPAPTAPP